MAAEERSILRRVAAVAARAARGVPGLRPIASYDGRALARDVLAGVVLAAFVVPVSMAYAPLAGLPPVFGLYASIAGLVGYALLGPSRHLVVGPDSSTAPLVAAAIIPLAAGDLSQRVSLAAFLSLAVGAMLVVTGLARLGFVTDLLAKPVRIGLLNGVALTIVIGQAPRALGLRDGSPSVVATVVRVASSLPDVQVLSALLAAGTALIALALTRVNPRAPGLFVAVTAATVASRMLGAPAHGVETVGPLPAGIPMGLHVRWPETGLGDLLLAALGIAVVTLADASVLSVALSHRAGDRRPSIDEEAIAVGAANLLSGLFQGFPVSASSTRSAVSVAAGATGQVAGLVAAALIVVMLTAAPGLLADLPSAALAAVAIVAAVKLADVSGTVRLLRLRRTEFALSLATFIAVVVLGVMPGVFVAVGLSVLNFVRRQWRPHDAVLGRVPGLKGYHDTAEFPEALEVPGLMLYRFDAPLFFANARVFQERLFARLAERAEPPRRVIIAAEPMIDVDTTAADVLAETIERLKACGIEVGFAELKHLVRERLARYGIIDLVGERMLFPTIGSAVHDHVAASGVEWVDWEDEERDAGEQDAHGPEAPCEG